MSRSQQPEYIILLSSVIPGFAENLLQLGAKLRSEMIQVSRSIEGATEAGGESEQVGMPECELYGSIPSHRQASYRACTFFSDRSVFCIDLRNDVLGDVVFKLVTGHGGGICIPGVIRIRHDDEK